jgi:tetratricopeptide (TPR) repeat protein
VILAFIVVAFRQASYWHDNETLYRHTLAVTRNNYLISHNLCRALVLADRLDEAEQFCRQAIAIKPDYFESFNTLGIIEFKRSRYAEAEADFSSAVLLAPNYLFANTNLAKAQARQGKPEKAEESLRKAIGLNGGALNDIFAEALGDIAAAYYAKQNYERSADNFRRLLVLRPNDADARARLALTLYSLDRLDEAETEARNSLNVKPDLVEGWNVLGLTLLRKQDYRGAAEAFQKVVAARPDFPEAKSNLERARTEAN